MLDQVHGVLCERCMCLQVPSLCRISTPISYSSFECKWTRMYPKILVISHFRWCLFVNSSSSIEIPPQARPPRRHPAPGRVVKLMSPQLPAAPCKPFLLANRVHVDGRVYLHVAAESSTATPGIQPSRQRLLLPSKPITCNTAHSFLPSLPAFQERTQCPKRPRV